MQGRLGLYVSSQMLDGDDVVPEEESDCLSYHSKQFAYDVDDLLGSGQT